MQFEFATSGTIIFGAGKLREAGPWLSKDGQRALVVTGKNIQRAEPLLKLLRENKVEAATFSVSGEPKIQTVRDGVALAKAEKCDWVIGIGGGSVLDAGKAIAAMMTNEGDVLDYLEIIGQGKALTKNPARYLAIPTTAGTGSEVTRNAVLASPEHRLKVSLRSAAMLPRIALVDPELTYDLPPGITASTGLDALTQLIEPYVCRRANPMTDALCLEGMRLVARSFRRAVENGADAQAREDMAAASLFGGMALANAGLGAVHGFAGPIGGMFSAPHGEICAALLADVMEMNWHALRERDPKNQAVNRYDLIARLLTENARATAGAGIRWIRELASDFKITSLGSHGIKAEHTDEIVKNAMNASSMKANPIALTEAELAEVLRRTLQPSAKK
jgi:alcohol dehydrogenase class IV